MIIKFIELLKRREVMYGNSGNSKLSSFLCKQRYSQLVDLYHNSKWFQFQNGENLFRYYFQFQNSELVFFISYV
jgi:hypothetical protein